jgi:hypothetical protein
MNGIESMRPAEKICRRFAGASYAAEFRYAMWFDAVFVKGFDDLRRDCIVTASGAERGIRALVVGYRETEPVGISGRRSGWLNRCRH